MNKIIEFFKTTFLGGLFVLLPIILLYLALGEVMGVLVAMATPFADLFFPGQFEDTQFPALVALALLIGVSFILGLVMLSETSRRFGNWIERTILGRLPAYNAMKSLTTGFSDSQQESAFKPALLKSAEGEKAFVYIVEDHGDGNLTVMLPWTGQADSSWPLATKNFASSALYTATRPPIQASVFCSGPNPFATSVFSVVLNSCLICRRVNSR